MIIMSSKISSVILSVLLMFISCFGLFIFSEKTEDEIRNRYELVNKIPLSGLKREVIDVLVLGQAPIYDNFVHLWTTQYLGSQELLQENPDILASKLREVLHLNIKSESFYLLSCFRFIFHFKRPELCHPIALKGMQVMPDRWMIPAALAYAYLEEERFEESANIFDAAGQIEGAPEYFRTVGDKLRSKQVIDPAVQNEILEVLGNEEVGKEVIKTMSKP